MKRNIKRGSRAILGLILIMSMLTMFVPNVSASYNGWYDKYTAYESSIRDDYYTSTSSADLSWSESYLLQSYVEMYNNTRSTAWLDILTSHVDTMIANANDADGDGYLGWDTNAYSNQDVVNPGFETGASGDTTRPDTWTRYQSTSTTAFRSTASKYTGSYGLEIRNNPAAGWQCLYKDVAYVPHAKYSLTFQCSTDGVIGGHCYVIDKTTSTILCDLYTTTSAWNTYYGTWVAPVAGHDVEVWCTTDNYTTVGGKIYIDNVNIKGYFSYISQEGMITLPMAQFVRLVHDVPALQATYQTKADTYQSFIEDEIYPKWNSSSAFYGNCWVQVDTDHGYYKWPAAFDTYYSSDPGTQLPYNMYLCYANTLLQLYYVNNNAGMLDKSYDMVRRWASTLTTSGSTYLWKYASYETQYEDAAHAQVDIAMAIAAYKANSGIFSGTDMEKFTDTLTTNMWNGSLVSPTVDKYVNGTGDTSDTRFISGWTELAMFDSRVWSIAAEQFRSPNCSEPSDLLVLAQIMKWDPVKIANNGFEYRSSADSTLPARWTRYQCTSANANLVYDCTYGEFGFKITTDGTKWNILEQSISQYSASSGYTCYFNAKTSNAAVGAKVEAYDATTGIVLGSATIYNTSWTAGSFTFTTPANTTDNIKVRLYSTAYTTANVGLTFDDVIFKRTGDTW